MTSRATYQNIWPEETGKPWSVMLPDAEGRGRHNLPGFPVTEGQISWYCRPRRHMARTLCAYCSL